jgi:hypothetical protein
MPEKKRTPKAILLRVDVHTLRDIDAIARAKKTTRSDAIRAAISETFEHTSHAKIFDALVAIESKLATVHSPSPDEQARTEKQDKRWDAVVDWVKSVNETVRSIERKMSDLENTVNNNDEVINRSVRELARTLEHAPNLKK